jgi:16S rRNA (cytidine1402-2'-O)-methyltransferase
MPEPPEFQTPGSFWPGACIEQEIEIECLPGPTAFVPALVNSGFPCDRFVFEGFLPVKKGRQTRLELLAQETRTLILYESPHKLVKTLTQICEFFGEDRMISISRELTKLYEETRRGTARALKEHYGSHPPKGEIVIVIEGNSDKKGKS